MTFFDVSEIVFVIITAVGVPLISYSFIPVNYLVYIYWILIGCFCFTSLWVFIESISSLFFKSSSDNVIVDETKSILILIPAYMDNEQFVLKDTLEAFSKLAYKGPIKVVVVYNVKDKSKTLEFENYLVENWDRKMLKNITFTIMENKNSKSKAENVNYALKQTLHDDVDYIGVFDADHQPSMDNIHKALEVFAEKNCDIVQGQCAIRNITDCFLSRIITMEFTEMYNIGHQGRVNVFGLGIFGGSNGLWKASLLRQVGMDHTMLTEDIDSSFKSLTQGAKIAYARNMESFELSPIFWDVLVKQRKRWAQGWLEVSIKYFKKSLSCKHFTFRQRIGCFLILFWRDTFVYLTFHPICIILGDLIQEGHLFKTTNIQISITLTMLLMGFVKSSLVFFVANKTMKNTLPKYWYIIYILFYPFYAIFMNVVHISTHLRYMTNRTEWVATTRETSPTPSQKSFTDSEVEVVVE